MTSPLAGFLAYEAEDSAPAFESGSAEESTFTCGATTLVTWGLTAASPGRAVFVPSRVRRSDAGAVTDDQIVAMVDTDRDAAMRLLPPFAVVAGGADGVTMLADSMGFRQLYHSAPGAPGAVAMSASAFEAARVRRAPLNDEALAVQSLLGWQLGHRTLHDGIVKLAPGTVATMSSGGLSLESRDTTARSSLPLDEAVRRAADVLRRSMDALLDDHPEAVLQLTGGQDSRLLLSAVPRSRRRGLRAMTLGPEDAGDVRVARELAARDGLDHEVHGLQSLESLTPSAAWNLCTDAALRLDGMSDPVALAALEVAERAFDQGVRISGLGGEVARGFYYLGRVHDKSYSRRDVEQLAMWRMFANESVQAGALKPEFSRWALQSALGDVESSLRAGGDEWFRATDRLYLHDRMQRWAGVTDTAVGDRRIVVNPMLHHEFLSLADGLRPEDKANALFLSRLQMELDPELGTVPLEGRPAPRSYAYPTPLGRANLAVERGRRAARKVVQRLSRTRRAPAGGPQLTRLVVEHWRRNPDVLDRREVRRLFDESWLAAVLSGSVDPTPSTVGFLTNVLVADATSASAHTFRE